MVPIRIFHRLFLAFVFVAISAMAALALTTQWRLNRDFLSYINALDEQRVRDVAAELSILPFEKEDVSLRGRDWDDLWSSAPQPPRPRADRRPPGPRGPRDRAQRRPPREAPPPPRARPPEGNLDLRNRVSLESMDGFPVGGPPRGQLVSPQPIEVTRNGEAIATLYWQPLKELRDSPAADLLRRQQRGLIISILALTVLGALSALVFARHFSHPIRTIAAASQRLARQDFSARVDIRRSDEVGDLALSFNHLAAALQDFDRARRRAFADTAHELRTPLTVVQGQLEAMLDGIRPMNAESVDMLLRRIQGLSTLVNDLYLLAQADAGSLQFQMRSVRVSALLDDVIADYTPLFDKEHLFIRREDSGNGSGICYADPDRLTQVFSNLVANSLHYTDAPGGLQIRVVNQDALIQIYFEDTPPGVDGDELASLGTTGFRGEGARLARSHGAGLGLALCERIVQGHKGEMTISSSSQGGLQVRIQLRTQ